MRRRQMRDGLIGFSATASSVLLIAGSPASAQHDENSWIRFGSQPASHSSGSYNRSFIREWEANPPRGYPTISKANIAPTKAAIKRYRKIVKNGGWKKLPKMPRKAKLGTGMTDPKVAIVHDRLIASGHLRSASSYPSYFDYTLEKAVKRFQASNGLTPTGVVDFRTRRALNVPAKVRLRQL